MKKTPSEQDRILDKLLYFLAIKCRLQRESFSVYRKGFEAGVYTALEVIRASDPGTKEMMLENFRVALLSRPDPSEERLWNTPVRTKN